MKLSTKKRVKLMNEVVLIGRLTRDPEIRYTQSQMAICNFTLAVDRPYSKSRQDNAPTADFIRITVFDRQAENCNQYLSKGSQAAVQGRIQTGSYKNKNGDTVYTTDVVAGRVEFLGSRNGNEQQNQRQEQTPQYQAPRYQPPAAPRERQQRFDDIDDEIPEGFETIDEDDVPF